MAEGYALQQLASMLTATLHGDPECKIFGVAPLDEATRGQASFIESRKHGKSLEHTRASVVLLPEDLLMTCKTNALVVSQPRKAFFELVRLFFPRAKPAVGIHPSCIVGQDCLIDPSASLGPGVVIGNRVRIGPDTVVGAGSIIGDGSEIGAEGHLYPRVTLYHGVKIGARVVIHSGAVLGADGFGFEPNAEGEWLKLLQVGGVEMGDDVEIGANTTIDRGALSNTVIGSGVKLDNLVMIAHNVIIGDHTIIAGCTGIAGSAKIGRHCRIGGHTAINGHIELADHVVITGAAMVTRSLQTSGVYSSGTGILPNREWLRSAVRFKQLDNMYHRLQQLERERT